MCLSVCVVHVAVQAFSSAVFESFSCISHTVVKLTCTLTMRYTRIPMQIDDLKGQIEELKAAIAKSK